MSNSPNDETLEEENKSILFKKNLTILEIISVPTILFSLLLFFQVGPSGFGNSGGGGFGMQMMLFLGQWGLILGVAILVLSKFLRRKNN